MKLRKKFIAGFLSVAMIATSLQFPAGSVQAEEGKEEIIQEAVVGEDADNTKENVSESTTDTERSSSTSSESTEIAEENSSVPSEGTEVLEIEESKEIETSAETMESEEQEEKSESENTEQETKDDESETCEEESIIEETSTEEEEKTETEVVLSIPENTIADGSYEDITWYISSGGKLVVEGTGDFSASADSDRAPWYVYRKYITYAVIEVTGMTDASYMFYGCSNLTNLSLGEFDTSNLTNMQGMFEGCISCDGKIKVGNFDTSNVTNMNSTFKNSKNISGFLLKHFNTSEVTDMSAMFEGCSDGLDLSNFNTAKVTDMSAMFKDCKFSSLDLSSFDTGNVTNMENIFSGCSSLKQIITPQNVKCSAELPVSEGYAWYHPDGTQIALLPQNLADSIKIVKNTTGSYENIVWHLDSEGKLIVEGSGEFSNSTNSDRAPWYGCREKIKSVEVKVTGMTDASYMFYGCINLVSINLGGFDTSNITNMASMFCNCNNLSSIDLDRFKTDEVTNMNCMFQGCSVLSSLDLSSFDTENVTDMNGMFSGCSKLSDLNLSSFDTTKVSSMSSMFTNCSSLKVLDLSNFNAANVESMNSIFYGCNGLNKISTLCNVKCSVELPVYLDYVWYDSSGNAIAQLPQNLSDSIVITRKVQGTYDGITWSIDADGKLLVEGVGDFPDSGGVPWSQYAEKIYSAEIKVSEMTDAAGMFYGCNNLNSLDLSGFNTSYVIDMSNMFYGCSNLSSLNLEGFDTSKVINMSNMFRGCSKLSSLNLGDFSTNKTTNMSCMFYGCNSLQDLDLSSFDTSKVTDMNSMFSGCYSLTSLDLSKFDTTRVTDMHRMFRDCGSLTSLDLSNFDTSNVTSIYSMFYGCIGLKNLNVSSFNTSKVTGMHHMFRDCCNLVDLDLSSFDTSNVTSMYYMFSECSSLNSLNLDNFDTSNVKSMGYMFESCDSLNSLNLSSFITDNTTEMLHMFEYCSSLTALDLSSFDTSNVRTMEGMFYGCNSLISLNLNNFDTRNVTNMELMFSECSSLVDLNLSGFNTNKVESIYCMFDGCSSLTSLDLSSFCVGNTDVWDILDNCSNLVLLKTPRYIVYGLGLPTNPGDVWYKADGTVITEVPTELSYSITIARNKVPTVEASHITANKRKTIYKTGDTLNIDDLSVMYHDNDGTIRKVTDFSTNADEIDMSVSGTKTLIVTYNDLKAEVELTVEKEGEEPTEKEKVTISGIEMSDSIYTGKSVSFSGKTVVTSNDEKDVTENVTLTYSYSGKQADGSDYAVTDKAPVNAGEYKLTVAVSEDNENYTGSSEYAFTIAQAPITITAQDKELAVGSPAPESYEYEITGLLNEDKLIKEPSFICNAEMDKAGTYEIMPQDADAGMNYKISYNKGTLTLKETPPEKGNVTISGIEVPDIVYNGKEASYVGTALVTSQDGKNVTESVALTYTYSGKQADGSDYAVTDKAPVNAGEYKLTVAVSEDNENYTGSSEYTFSIAQAPIEITALDEELVIGSPAPESYQYRVDGLLNEDKLIKEPLFTCNVDIEKVGTYEIIPHDADAGMNYKITYNKGTLTVTENGIRYTVSFDLAGHGTAIAPVKNVRSGSLIEEPKQPVEQGYRFMGWYKDKLCTEAWDFAKDMVESDITLYACWLTESSGNEGADLCIQEIQTQTYTGKAIKPSVLVYSADGTMLLKSGKDYVIKYYNNTEADTDAEASLGGTSQTGKEGDNGFSQKLAYVCITGKGNYEGTVYRNFHIAPVSITGNDGNLANGAVLKYSEQLTVNNSKAQKPFSSLKYKKNMKAGVDFEVKLTALEAYDAGGHVLSGVAIDESNLIPSIPAGYKGSFSLSIKGINNYSGEVSRKVYVSEKAHLMKNATITLGKNLKNMEYTGQSITLTPAYYDASAKKYYAIDASGAVSTQAEPNGDNVFTVRIGKEYLIYGKDYSISYTNNCASGSATMTVAGTGDYAGTKDIKFKISGKAFSAKQISVENLQSVMTYTGKAVTQDNVVLKMNGRELVCGKDYTVTYKNNLKKGTASMIFKAVEESGYSGSFTTKFKIGAAELKDTVKVIPIDSSFGDNVVYDNAGIKLIGTVPYSKEGAKISDRVSLTNGSNTLKEGIDYTVSYVNNQSVTVGTNSIATMNIKGKGNYSGNLSVQFVITEAPMEENQNLTVVATATPYNSGKADSYQYQPKIKITDGKKVLSAQTDYVVEYRNCTQSAVKAYLEALKKDISTEDMKPQAVISAKTGSGYIGSVTTDLTIYEEKLTAKNLYIVVSDVTEQITYNGSQVKPEIMVYYGDSKAVKEAKTANEKDEKVLTDKSGTYCLTKLAEKSDYVVSYGSNSIAGKNKGNVTVTGIGMYGGNVKIAFTILRRDVYGEK